MLFVSGDTLVLEVLDFRSMVGRLCFSRRVKMLHYTN